MQGSVVVIAECRDDRTNWRRSTTVPCTGWARAVIARRAHARWSAGMRATTLPCHVFTFDPAEIPDSFLKIFGLFANILPRPNLVNI